MKDSAWGFGLGAGTGIVLVLVTLLVADPGFEPVAGGSSRASLGQWLDVNLGYSVWLFAVVLTLYGLNLRRLGQLLDDEPNLRHIVELDQLSDVWIHLFVGIGVIWTAIGMRSALQAALGDPGQALVETAGSVLQKLVDGGILLALTTTIVGGVGGYLMRLAKTMMVGASLQDYYDQVGRFDTRELLRSTLRIEARLEMLERSKPVAGGA
ncbi:MAG: hypothetical protein VB948_11660 [Pseudomonadales bacterium]